MKDVTTPTHTGEYTNIAIPQSLLYQAHLLGSELSFELRNDGLLIKQSVHPRAGWEKYYAPLKEEEYFLADIDHEFNDEEDWVWE